MSAKKDWPHAPTHRLDSDGIYMVTGATEHKEHIFTSAQKLNLLENELLSIARCYQWRLEAWAVFVNHYQFVARGKAEEDSLQKFLKHLHSNTARNVNELDDCSGRSVWHNFWDTKLTYERSYLARLNYVHQTR